jgi:hypothetical protein
LGGGRSLLRWWVWPIPDDSGGSVLKGNDGGALSMGQEDVTHLVVVRRNRRRFGIGGDAEARVGQASSLGDNPGTLRWRFRVRVRRGRRKSVERTGAGAGDRVCQAGGGARGRALTVARKVVRDHQIDVPGLPVVGLVGFPSFPLTQAKCSLVAIGVVSLHRQVVCGLEGEEVYKVGDPRCGKLVDA